MPAAGRKEAGSGIASSVSLVQVSRLTMRRNAEDMPVTEVTAASLSAGAEVTFCYAYADAMSQARLVVVVTGPDGAAHRPIESPPFQPHYTASERCEPLAGLATLPPGGDALLGEDRGHERARRADDHHADARTDTRTDTRTDHAPISAGAAGVFGHVGTCPAHVRPRPPAIASIG